MVNTHQPLAGLNLLILVVTVVVDLGGLGGGGIPSPDAVGLEHGQGLRLAKN